MKSKNKYIIRLVVETSSKVTKTELAHTIEAKLPLTMIHWPRPNWLTTDPIIEKARVQKVDAD